MIVASDDSTSPTSVTTPADDLAHLLPLAAFNNWRFGRPTTDLFALGLATILPSRGTELCERGEIDHDEGPVDAPPRSRDGTRYAGLLDLMHAPLLTDSWLSLSLRLTHATRPTSGRGCKTRASDDKEEEEEMVQLERGKETAPGTRETTRVAARPRLREGGRTEQRAHHGDDSDDDDTEMLRGRDPTSVPRSRRLTRRDATRRNSPPPSPAALIRPYFRRAVAAPRRVMRYEVQRGTEIEKGWWRRRPVHRAERQRGPFDRPSGERADDRHTRERASVERLDRKVQRSR